MHLVMLYCLIASLSVLLLNCRDVISGGFVRMLLESEADDRDGGYSLECPFFRPASYSE